jgi:hypothetical protein
MSDSSGSKERSADSTIDLFFEDRQLKVRGRQGGGGAGHIRLYLLGLHSPPV